MLIKVSAQDINVEGIILEPYMLHDLEVINHRLWREEAAQEEVKLFQERIEVLKAEERICSYQWTYSYI